MDGIADPHDWLTQRAAAEALADGLGIHPETARRLIVAGVLGRPRATSVASFHRRDAVDAFVDARLVNTPLPVPDRNLVFVRVGNGRVRMGATEQHQLDRLSRGWRMSPQWRVLCNAIVDAGGQRVGFVVCLGGYVVAGADIVRAEWAGAEIDGADLRSVASVLTNFDLQPPGAWFDAWRGRLLPTYVGGAPLRVWILGERAPWDRAPRMRG